MGAASQSLDKRVRLLELDQRAGLLTGYYYIVYNQPFGWLVSASYQAD